MINIFSESNELALELSIEEQKSVIKYIKDRAFMLGFPAPDRCKQHSKDDSKESDDDSILHYISNSDSGCIFEELLSSNCNT